MCIMPWCSAETAVLIEAAENEVDYSISRKCFGLAKQMESRQTPIDPADAQVFGKMIFELVTTLL